MPKSFNDLPVPVQVAVFVLIAAGSGRRSFLRLRPPLKEKRDSLRKEVDRLKAENQRNQVFERERTEYLNRIAQLEKQLDTLRSIVPDEQATDDFMRMVFEDGRTSRGEYPHFCSAGLGAEGHLHGDAFQPANGRHLLWVARASSIAWRTNNELSVFPVFRWVPLRGEAWERSRFIPAKRWGRIAC